MTLIECSICLHTYGNKVTRSIFREHCPVCAARRILTASHSFEPYCVRITPKAMNHFTHVPLARAYRSNIAASIVR